MNIKTANIYTIRIELNKQISFIDTSPKDIIFGWENHVVNKATDNQFNYVIAEDETNSITLSIHLSAHDSHILFGTLSKTQLLAEKPLQRVSDINHKPVDTTNLRIEDFTYFYFDLSTLQCAVLSNNKAPNFKRYFQYFLENLSPNNVLIYITQTLADDFDEKLNITAKLLSASFVFNQSSPLGMTDMNLADAFLISGKDIEKVTVNIKYKKASLTEEEIQKLRNKDYMKESCTKADIKISEDEEIVLDAVNHYLRKKISLNLNDQDLLNSKNMEIIKKALANCLTSSSL